MRTGASLDTVPLMTLLLIYLALALGISFLCSILETVLLSVNAPYIAALEQEDRWPRASS